MRLTDLHYSVLMAITMLSHMIAANPLYQMVDAPLHRAAVEALLDCMKATAKAYSIAVNVDGTIAISPTKLRALDFGTTDKMLWDCVKEATKELRVAVDSSSWSDHGELERVDAESITYEYLEGGSARGQVAQLVETAMGRMAQPVGNSTVPQIRHAQETLTVPPNSMFFQNYLYLDQGGRC